MALEKQLSAQISIHKLQSEKTNLNVTNPLETPKATATDILPSERSHHLILPKQPPTMDNVFKYPRHMMEGISHNMKG